MKWICENKEEWKKKDRKRMEALVKKSGGSPFLFFENRKEMMDYLIKKLEFAEEHAESFLSEAGIQGHGVLCLLPESGDIISTDKLSTCLRDERNPYYDKEQAVKNGFDLAINLPVYLLCYAVEHGMMPDVGMNSVYGVERGQKLFRENYGLLQRAIMGNDLIEM